MIRTISLCLAALLAASPALAQTVTVSEPQTRPLSPTLGGTETLAIVTPAQAEAMTEIPMVNILPESGAVSASLGETRSLAVVTPSVAETLTVEPSVESVAAPSVLDTLPRVTAEQIATFALDEPLTVDPSAPPAEEDVSLYVVGDGTILPATTWSAKDSETCKASGGVELPLPGARIGCFKL